MTSAADDEIVEEIRHRREAHAKSLGNDLKRITEDFRRQERESGTLVVSRRPRAPRGAPKRASA
jgi:hypothetical protein